MKLLLICIVFVLGVSLAAAFEGKIYQAKIPYFKKQRGDKSTGVDDSTSEARCGNYFHYVNCSCTPRKNCDGAFMFSDKEGLKCVAFNKAGRDFGVDSYAHCARFTVNVESETKTDPVASCPPNYKILSCMLHSYRQDEHPTCRAIMNSGKCVVSGKGCKSCTKCRMQARCIRFKNFTDE